MKQYSYNCVTNTLTLSRAFVRQAEVKDSEEYRLVKLMREEIPGLVVAQKPKEYRRRSRYANLSVKAMKDYICCMRDSEERLAELDAVISASRLQEHPISFIRTWFLKNYPSYNSIPSFDEDGYLLPGTA